MHSVLYKNWQILCFWGNLAFLQLMSHYTLTKENVGSSGGIFCSTEFKIKCRVFSLVCCLWLILRSPRGHLHQRPTNVSTTQRGGRPWVDLLCPRESWPNLSDAEQRENQRGVRECPDNRTDPHNRFSQLSGHWSLYLLWSEQPGTSHREYQCWSSLWVFRLTITKRQTKKVYGALLFPALLNWRILSVWNRWLKSDPLNCLWEHWGLLRLEGHKIISELLSMSTLK